MNRIYAIMLALLLGACWNDDSSEETPADNTASQGESAEKVYSLEGHPLAKYNTAEDYKIHESMFLGLRGGISMEGRHLEDSCVLQPACEKERAEYERAVALYEKEGRYPDGVRPIHVRMYYLQCVPEGVEEICKQTVDLTLTNLQNVGRTDVTEAHLRNPAFWQLQNEVRTAYDKKIEQFKAEIAAREEAERALCNYRKGHLFPWECPDKSYAISDPGNPLGAPEAVSAYEAARAAVKVAEAAQGDFYGEAEARNQRFKDGAY